MDRTAQGFSREQWWVLAGLVTPQAGVTLHSGLRQQWVSPLDLESTRYI